MTVRTWRRMGLAAFLVLAIITWFRPAQGPEVALPNGNVLNLHQFYFRTNGNDLWREIGRYLVQVFDGASRQDVMAAMQQAGWRCLNQPDWEIAEPHASCAFQHGGAWWPLREKMFWTTMFFFGAEDRLRRADVVVVPDK
jgi:hypothetical protein